MPLMHTRYSPSLLLLLLLLIVPILAFANEDFGFPRPANATTVEEVLEYVQNAARFYQLFARALAMDTLISKKLQRDHSSSSSNEGGLYPLSMWMAKYTSKMSMEYINKLGQDFGYIKKLSDILDNENLRHRLQQLPSYDEDAETLIAIEWVYTAYTPPNIPDSDELSKELCLERDGPLTKKDEQVFFHMQLDVGKSWLDLRQRGQELRVYSHMPMVKCVIDAFTVEEEYFKRLWALATMLLKFSCDEQRYQKYMSTSSNEARKQMIDASCAE